jgi:hypothetical protein
MKQQAAKIGLLVFLVLAAMTSWWPLFPPPVQPVALPPVLQDTTNTHPLLEGLTHRKLELRYTMRLDSSGKTLDCAATREIPLGGHWISPERGWKSGRARVDVLANGEYLASTRSIHTKRVWVAGSRSLLEKAEAHSFSLHIAVYPAEDDPLLKKLR